MEAHSQRQLQEEQLKTLNRFMLIAMTHRKDEKAKRLIFFIRRTLRQFHLTSKIEDYEILIEVYLVTRRTILKNVVIENLFGWLCRVAFFIIRDHSKKEQRIKDLANRLIHYGQYSTHTSDADINAQSADRMSALLEAFASLEEDEIELLKLRHVQGLSWREIQLVWHQDTGVLIKEATLRKRHTRLLARLRESILAYEAKVGESNPLKPVSPTGEVTL